jgi:hypothetical protein
MFPIGEYVILPRKFSEHVSIVSGRHKMFGNTIVQKISTKKRRCRNRWQEPMCSPSWKSTVLFKTKLREEHGKVVV